MRLILIVLLGASTAGLSDSALAQTCASPLRLSSYTAVEGDLCTGVNSLPTYGGVTSPQKEIVYSFVAHVPDTTISYDVANGYTGVMYLMPSPCAPSTDPIAFGGSTGTLMQASGLVDGQTYYVIVTANPGGAEDACGTFRISVGNLPVSLKSFSVE